MGLFGPSNQDVIDHIEALREEMHAYANVETIRARIFRSQLRDIQCKLNFLLMDRLHPGPLHTTVVSEGENDMLRFQVQLPPLPAGPNDIDHGELIVVINGAALAPITVAKEATLVDHPTLLGPDNAAVHLEFRYVDDSANKSQPSVLDTVLLDTVAPPPPGTLGLVAVEEVFEGGLTGGGPTGPIGPTGAVGPTGDVGPTGPIGPTGSA